MKEQNVMCILSGTSEPCYQECPMYDKCWNQEEMDKKANDNKKR